MHLPFLTVDGQDVPLSRCLGYLRVSGHLALVLGEILRRYVLERELARRPDIAVNDLLVDIAVADFCEQRQLGDRRMLDEWLIAHDEDHASLTARIREEFRFETLKHAITSADLEQYFLDRKPFLDKVVLSQFAVASEQEAADLKARLEAAVCSGQAAASMAGEGGVVTPGAVERVALLPALRDALETVGPGAVIGPLAESDAWAIYLFAEDLPASLEDGAIKQALRDELFERWIGEQLERLTVEINVPPDQ